MRIEIMKLQTMSGTKEQSIHELGIDMDRV